MNVVSSSFTVFCCKGTTFFCGVGAYWCLLMPNRMVFRESGLFCPLDVP